MHEFWTDKGKKLQTITLRLLTFHHLSSVTCLLSLSPLHLGKATGSISKTSPLGHLHAFTHGSPLPTSVVPGLPLLSEEPTEAGNVAIHRPFGSPTRHDGAGMPPIARRRHGSRAQDIRFVPLPCANLTGCLDGWKRAERNKNSLTIVQKITGTD